MHNRTYPSFENLSDIFNSNHSRILGVKCTSQILVTKIDERMLASTSATANRLFGVDCRDFRAIEPSFQCNFCRRENVDKCLEEFDLEDNKSRVVL